MKYPHLIILYGRFGDRQHEKQQAMIYGGSVCGYRDYAKQFGEIIYLCPQDTKENWDSDIRFYNNDPKRIINKIKNWYPDSIVWSVKHDPTKQKDRLLEQLPNKKVFYSCCSCDTTNSSCDVSLVDTPERVKGNAVLWVKGKDPEFWKPQGSKKVFDYCMIGKRGDKNEVWFIDQLTDKIKEKRNIIWIGGEKHAYKMKKSHHNIACTQFSGPVDVRNYIDLAKVGILLSEIPAEGMPQSLIEMLIMGLPVVYLGPQSPLYKCRGMILQKTKDNAVVYAENELKSIWIDRSNRVLVDAVETFSLEKSYESILRGLKYDI